METRKLTTIRIDKELLTTARATSQMFDWLFPKKKYPWPEDAITAGRKQVRLIGVKLNPNPCV